MASWLHIQASSSHFFIFIPFFYFFLQIVTFARQFLKYPLLFPIFLIFPEKFIVLNLKQKEEEGVMVFIFQTYIAMNSSRLHIHFLFLSNNFHIPLSPATITTSKLPPLLSLASFLFFRFCNSFHSL